MATPQQVLNALDDNAEVALDEIGFGPPDKGCVRDRVCPFHPDEPEHQVGVWQARVSKGLVCDVTVLPDKNALDVYMICNGINNRVNAAKNLSNVLVAKYGKERLNLTALREAD